MELTRVGTLLRRAGAGDFYNIDDCAILPNVEIGNDMTPEVGNRRLYGGYAFFDS